MAPKHKLRAKDIRNLKEEQIEKNLQEFRQELLSLRHKAEMGTLTNPGRLRELRRNIARILTIKGEQRGGAEGQ
ncbi:MAG: 50S ribosomal protein L29 [Acidilobaceae archaeon]